MVAATVSLAAVVRVPPSTLVTSSVVAVVGGDDREAEIVALEGPVSIEEALPVAVDSIVLPSKSEGTLGPTSELVRRRADPLRVSKDWEKESWASVRPMR